MKYLFGLIMSFNASADDWFCSTESGRRNDKVFWACGVGESQVEGAARTKALQAAVDEFTTICKMSSDCKDKPMRVEPKRLTCKEDKLGFYKCYRLIEVEIGD